MISQINLISNTEDAVLDFHFGTSQTFYFKVEIQDSNGNPLFTDNGQWNGKTSFDLGSPTSLIGNYLVIYWSCLDLNGAGNPFNALAIVSQNNKKCAEPQVFKGTSIANGNVDMTTAKIFKAGI
ncbi:hypothetical protein [Mucilaginibacter sp. KACC 22063]|uniref:hypothetical protein n=1 Tax=Mucilaginibacter sp. KACC 22063 TaxID=3025666 RepID=UPI002364FECE|nr:hypothetical protein [Mucilaginibacter sp. KACC 22063]WDF54570.1 hypothetical protein PQ461_16685 [Mucilaginibacter sp. KACC 22063]